MIVRIQSRIIQSLTSRNVSLKSARPTSSVPRTSQLPWSSPLPSSIVLLPPHSICLPPMMARAGVPLPSRPLCAPFHLPRTRHVPNQFQLLENPQDGPNNIPVENLVCGGCLKPTRLNQFSHFIAFPLPTNNQSVSPCPGVVIASQMPASSARVLEHGPPTLQQPMIPLPSSIAAAPMARIPPAFRSAPSVATTRTPSFRYRQLGKAARYLAKCLSSSFGVPTCAVSCLQGPAELV